MRKPSCWIFLAASVCQAAPVLLSNDAVRIEIIETSSGITERFLVKQSGKWVAVAKNDGKTAGSTTVEEFAGVQKATSQTVHKVGDAIVEMIRGAGWSIERTMQLEGKNGWVRVTNTFRPEHPLRMHSLSDRFQAESKPAWSYSPSVGGFNPDAKYKAPLILVQNGGLAFGIVPDLLSLNREVLKQCNHAIDLNVPGTTTLKVGFIPAQRALHSVYKEDLDRAWTASEPIVNSYYIYLNGAAPANLAYRDAVRFHWEKFGRTELRYAADEQSATDSKYKQCGLFDDWRKAVWDEESPREWLNIPLPDGSKGGAVRMLRAGKPKHSLYLSSWFNSLRTSYAMALYARRTNNVKLMDLAKQTVNLALKAPGRDGAFKCFAIEGETAEKVIWGAGDGAVDSVSRGYLGFDMSWTGYWLLKWHEAGLPDSEEIVPRSKRLAAFLIADQGADGWIPTRFDESAQVDDARASRVPAETAPVARFLLELHKVTGDSQYRDAALKALAFLDRAVIPERKWYDYETFWSCNPRMEYFDERTQQWPANNLALIHAPEAYLQAYQSTHDQRYLTKGEELLDYLLLYQQSWTNPVLENLSSKAMLLGGFTTQNSDAEWSDARQSLAGEVLIDYYRETGKSEYLERGVSALRSQFPISPSENWAHEGYGKKAGVSSFHWGAGSGMAGIEMEEDLLHDAICAAKEARCVGVNGINILDASFQDPAIAIKAESPYRWNRPAIFTVRGLNSASEYSLSVNGGAAKKYSGRELEAGVPVGL